MAQPLKHRQSDSGGSSGDGQRVDTKLLLISSLSLRPFAIIATSLCSASFRDRRQSCTHTDTYSVTAYLTTVIHCCRMTRQGRHGQLDGKYLERVQLPEKAKFGGFVADT